MKSGKILVVCVLATFLLAACTGPAAKPKKDGMPAAPAPGTEAEMDKNNDDIVTPPAEETMEDETAKEDEMAESGQDLPGVVFDNKIVMANVSDQADAKGEGFYGQVDGETRVYANFMVEDPAKGYFYEGWLICNGKPLSTGKLEKFEGLYENWFSSKDINATCNKYVLTIEPDDGDPAPADHVMDGEIQGIAHTEPSMDWNDEKFETMASKTS